MMKKIDEAYGLTFEQYRIKQEQTAEEEKEQQKSQLMEKFTEFNKNLKKYLSYAVQQHDSQVSHVKVLHVLKFVGIVIAIGLLIGVMQLDNTGNSALFYFWIIIDCIIMLVDGPMYFF